MKNIKKHLTNQSGQMVILVMLVMVIALTIGLSLLSRTIQNTRLSTNTELSNRAYSAAEAGIEEALRQGGSDTGGTNQNIGSNANQSTYNTDILVQGNSSDPYVFPNPLSQDEAVQLWLFDYTGYSSSSTFPNVNCSDGDFYINECGNKDLTISWGNSSALNSSTPALEVSFIYKNGANNSVNSSNTFEVEKCTYDPFSTRVPANNFSNTSTNPDGTTCHPTGLGNLSTTSHQVAGKTFNFSKTIRMASAGAAGGSGRKYLLMRLKLLYNGSGQKHEIAVTPGSGVTLPAQGQIIESEGTAGDVVRKIRVYQSYPTLPGIFDFVLFNGSDTELSKQ